jgi:hypothetical protein
VGDFNNGRIYDSKMNGNRTDLVLNGSILKNTTGTHNESSYKIILSNTCMSDNAENTIFGKGFNGVTDIKMGPNVQMVTCISFLILEVIYSE